MSRIENTPSSPVELSMEQLDLVAGGNPVVPPEGLPTYPTTDSPYVSFLIGQQIAHGPSTKM